MAGQTTPTLPAFDSISNALSEKITTAQNEVMDLKQKNLNNPNDMANYQMAVSKWTILNNLKSTIFKALKDALQGIISKM